MTAASTGFDVTPLRKATSWSGQERKRVSVPKPCVVTKYNGNIVEWPRKKASVSFYAMCCYQVQWQHGGVAKKESECQFLCHMLLQGTMATWRSGQERKRVSVLMPCVVAKYNGNMVEWPREKASFSSYAMCCCQVQRQYGPNRQYGWECSQLNTSNQKQHGGGSFVCFCFTNIHRLHMAAQQAKCRGHT